MFIHLSIREIHFLKCSLKVKHKRQPWSFFFSFSDWFGFGFGFGLAYHGREVMGFSVAEGGQ